MENWYYVILNIVFEAFMLMKKITVSMNMDEYIIYKYGIYIIM